MGKEWILNIATNRWGLNKKNSVGPVALWIRECNPKTLEEWKKCYYRKFQAMLKEKGILLSPEEYLESLGRKLYIKITEVLQAEIEDVEEEDCINYIKNLVLNRTYDGYLTEIKTIYGILQRKLELKGFNYKIKPAPDKLDRSYNVDFIIEVKNRLIGIQIKPITYEQTPLIHNWMEWLTKTHEKFYNKFGGKVFIVFSIKKERNRKEIFNKEIIDKIIEEIKRLERASNHP